MSKIKIDPYGAECSYCKAPVGFNCTYVHPKFWTPESQRRFFNNQTTEKQIQLLQLVGQYTKQPHMVRFNDAREAAEAKFAPQQPLWAAGTLNLGDQVEMGHGYLVFNGEGRSILKEQYNRGRDEGYREGIKEGIEEGKRIAINRIATGSDDG